MTDPAALEGEETMRLIYIAGPYRGKSESEVFSHIMLARDAAAEVWKLGAVAICPHLNSMLMGGMCPDDVWLKGDIEILSRCDAVLFVGNWLNSLGCVAERDFALRAGKATFYGLGRLTDWLNEGAR